MKIVFLSLGISTVLSGLLLSESKPAAAFNLVNTNTAKLSGVRQSEYQFAPTFLEGRFSPESGETVIKDYAISVSGVKNTNTSILGNARKSSYGEWQGTGAVQWTTTTNSASNSKGSTAVPEPLTILGSGIALGVGSLMERKYSRKRNKQVKQMEGEKV